MKLNTLEYDNLNNVFNWVCPVCGSNGMEEGVFILTPVNVSYKPDGLDNKDIINKIVRRHHDSVPVISRALITAHKNRLNGTSIDIQCTKCESHISPQGDMTTYDIRKWLHRNNKEYNDLDLKL